MKWKIILFIISVALLAILIYLSNPHAVLQTFFKARVDMLLVALFLSLVSSLVRTQRWKYLLDVHGIKIGFKQTFKLYVAGLYISNITPAKSGDPVRALLLKKETKIKARASLPSILIERFFDVISMILIGTIGMWVILQKIKTEVLLWFSFAVGIYLVLLIVFLALMFTNRIFWATKKSKRILSKLPKLSAYSSKIENFAEDIIKAFHSYKSKKIMFATLLYSVCIWILEAFVCYFCFLAADISVPIEMVIPATSVITLISVLTLLPAGMGSSEILSVVYFSAINLSMAEITAVALIARAIGFWYYILGSIFLATLKVKQT